MTLKNTNVVNEINEIFERMHARLDHRFQQLIRQINIHTNSSRRKSKFNHRKYSNIFLIFISDNSSVIFSPINQKQLEETINNFGHITTSINLNGMQPCESMYMHMAFNHLFLFTLFFPILNSD